MTWLGAGCSDGNATKRRDLSGVCEPRRGKAGQGGGGVTDRPRQESAGSAAKATQGAEAHPREKRRLTGAEAGVWTERMLSALGNGVKGGKWFSLMDKVFAPKTLALAWAKVKANRGAAGVDGLSIERFAAKAELYLAELATALRAGTYRPEAVKRVEI